MELKRRTSRYSSLYRRKSQGVLEELNVDPVEKKLAQYKQK